MIAVTGANGFVGGALCRDLAARGLTVRPLSRVAGYTLAGPVPPLDGVSAVVHCAHDMTAPRLNVDGTWRLLDAAFRAGVGQFVFVSSLAAHAGARSAYGRAKWELEQRLAHVTGLTVSVVKPGTVLGDGGLFRAGPPDGRRPAGAAGVLRPRAAADGADRRPVRRRGGGPPAAAHRHVRRRRAGRRAGGRVLPGRGGQIRPAAAAGAAAGRAGPAGRPRRRAGRRAGCRSRRTTCSGSNTWSPSTRPPRRRPWASRRATSMRHWRHCNDEPAGRPPPPLVGVRLLRPDAGRRRRADRLGRGRPALAAAVAGAHGLPRRGRRLPRPDRHRQGRRHAGRGHAGGDRVSGRGGVRADVPTAGPRRAGVGRGAGG